VEIALPNNWKQRPYQQPLLKYFEDGGKRAAVVWHRRAGKDDTSLNLAAVMAHVEKGLYWHMLPTATQGRKVIWDGIDKKGDRFIDRVFPKELRRGINNTEMKIDLKCGSMWQVVGSDNYDSLVGANPRGVIFSEYSIADPRAWDYIRPILRENGGWALFIFTPRGHNHGYKLYKMASRNSNWFSEILTIEDTGVMTKADAQEELDAGMPSEMVQQEFYCSFEAAMVGAYYGDVIKFLRERDRFTKVPWDPSHPVQTWWDFGIGVTDMTTILFTQYIGREWRFIDFYSNNTKGIAEYALELKGKPYQYDFHGGPHDVKRKSVQTGLSLQDYADKFGLEFTRVPRTLDLAGSINSTRQQLRGVVIDETKCEIVIDGLANYRRIWDNEAKVFLSKPVHDWSSHIADAVRTWADGNYLMTSNSEIILMGKTPVAQDYDPFNPPASSGGLIINPNEAVGAPPVPGLYGINSERIH